MAKKSILTPTATSVTSQFVMDGETPNTIKNPQYGDIVFTVDGKELETSGGKTGVALVQDKNDKLLSQPAIDKVAKEKNLSVEKATSLLVNSIYQKLTTAPKAATPAPTAPVVSDIQGFFKMGPGAIHQQVLDALNKGTNIIAGYPSREVDMLKPLYDQGLINSKEDVFNKLKEVTSKKVSVSNDIADVEKTLYGTISGTIPLSQALPNGIYIDLGNGLFAYADKNEKIAAIVDRVNGYVVSKSFLNTNTGWQLPNKANLKDDAKRFGINEDVYIKNIKMLVDILNSEVKPTEVIVEIEKPVSTQKVKIPGTKESKPIPLSDFTLEQDGERVFTKRIKKDDGGVNGVEPLNQFKLNQGWDANGNPYPKVHVILDNAEALKYQEKLSIGGKEIAKNPEI